MLEQTVIDFAAARERCETGIAKATEHAESDSPGWSDHAYALLRQFALQETTPWTCEQFRVWAYSRGLNKPDNERCFGSVTRRALSAKFVEKAGYAPAASSNGSIKPTYRWAQ